MRTTESAPLALPATTDLICFSPLRWGTPFQRPQHLLTRFARHHRVFYFEEPLFETRRRRPGYQSSRVDGVIRVAPLLPAPTTEVQAEDMLRSVIDDVLVAYNVHDFVTWYYTPMALPFTEHLTPSACVYDCIDGIAESAGSPGRRELLERQLLQHVDVVFTDGQRLREAKHRRHDNVHAFPSSIDAAHFRSARASEGDPADQAVIPHPRLGYYGVIDQRLDYRLIDEVAHLRRDWHVVLIGTYAGVDPDTLPKAPNIHYLGAKEYDSVPAYLGGWDVALMPLSRGASTRRVGHRKVPEYLASGIPVVSTSVDDVVNPYGAEGLIEIADEADEFIEAVERAMRMGDDRSWRLAVEHHLSGLSWDSIWCAMYDHVARVYRSGSREYELLLAGVSG